MIRVNLAISSGMGALALVAAACGGADSESERAAPTLAVATSATDPRCGAVPANLAGAYTMETEADELPPEVADMQVGTFELRLGPGHRVITVAPQGNEIDGRPACVRGTRIAVAEEPAGGGCSGLGPGVYDWALRGDELVFTKVEERCAYRAYTMTHAPWRRKPSG